jgi:hypothetical protein
MMEKELHEVLFCGNYDGGSFLFSYPHPDTLFGLNWICPIENLEKHTHKFFFPVRYFVFIINYIGKVSP